ncbi:MAG: PilZ domain-containing protein [Proteobacteria bacterium]|nr:PilZ domain-containing protein [Pseudomonadota bacterium]
MATRDLDHIENCPFWSALSMKCQICKGGLFIPMDDHMEAYCKTLNFPQCLQYSLHPKNHLEINAKESQGNRNRRNFGRVEACHKITLVKLIHSGKIVSHFSTFAKTLDLSSGGMRVTTNKPLLNDSIIQFSFGDSFPKDLHEATGLVVWCNKEIDDPSYQAGISFQDSHLIKAMGLYLGLHHREM